VAQKNFRLTSSTLVTSIAAQTPLRRADSQSVLLLHVGIFSIHPSFSRPWLALPRLLPPFSPSRRLHSFYHHHSGVISAKKPRRRGSDTPSSSANVPTVAEFIQNVVAQRRRDVEVRQSSSTTMEGHSALFNAHQTSCFDCIDRPHSTVVEGDQRLY
jgi:hypothetical protein